jgi:hypothetical protein
MAISGGFTVLVSRLASGEEQHIVMVSTPHERCPLKNPPNGDPETAFCSTYLGGNAWGCKFLKGITIEEGAIAIHCAAK